MISSQRVSVEDKNPSVLMEQVLGQMVERCIQSGVISKQQVVVLLEELIQHVERGTLASVLDSV
jgi:hypothetical protein